MLVWVFYIVEQKWTTNSANEEELKQNKKIEKKQQLDITINKLIM